MKTLSEIFSDYMDLPEFYGVQLQSVTQSGNTGDCPIHVAVHRKDIQEVVSLLAAGADPNARGEFGYTPLLVAVSNDLPAIVELLLGAGAKQEIANDDGVTPCQLIKSSQVRSLLDSARAQT